MSDVQHVAQEDLIRQAAEERQQIVFMYTKQGSFAEPELRVLLPDEQNPLRTSLSGRRYVIGHDVVREAPRQFRLDRIGPITTILPERIQRVPTRVLTA